MTSKNDIFYLWHLQMIGIVKNGADGQVQSLTNWGDEVTPVSDDPTAGRVALIDNGCTEEHPNLPSEQKSKITHERAAIVDAIDFAHNEGGLLFKGEHLAEALIPDVLDEVGLSPGEIDAELRDLAFEGDVPDYSSKALRDAIKLIQDPPHQTIELLPNPSKNFSAHGTACTGLIAGRPSKFWQESQIMKLEYHKTMIGDAGFLPTEAAEAAEPAEAKVNPFEMMYYGVSPNSQVIPINTSYDQEYWSVIMGLLWAVRQGAKVVLIPRSLPDHIVDGPTPPVGPRLTRIQGSRRLAAHKRFFEQLLASISEKVPVIVAAGNDGPGPLQYPARLVTDLPNLIVVGAVTSRGLRASYSSGEMDDATNGVTIYAPSDDAEIMSADFQRYDEKTWRGRSIKLGTSSGKENDYSPFGVLTTDIPGEFGYSGDERSSYREELQKINDASNEGTELFQSQSRTATVPASDNLASGLYTSFGGTSAASSIVAGVASLLQLNSVKPLSGSEMKEILSQTSKPASEVVELDGKNSESNLPVVNVEEALTLIKKKRSSDAKN